MSDQLEDVWREDAEALVQQIVVDCADRNGELRNLSRGVEHVLSFLRFVCQQGQASDILKRIARRAGDRRCTLTLSTVDLVEIRDCVKHFGH